jgi:aspartate/methionine/tyrosine aminotransferase
VKPFIVMDILARAHELEAQGHSVIHMEVGEPDLPPPAPVVRAACAALADNRIAYTPSFGTWELRSAISGYYRAEYGVDVDPARIVATTGTSGAFLLVLGAWFRRGERVAVTDPGYPCYPNFFEFLGLETVRIPVSAGNGYRPVIEDLDRLAGRVDGILLTSPSNPTGAMLTRADYRSALARVPRVISDEIYQGIVLDPGAEPFTAAEFGPHVAIVDGFSKKWSMTGLRLGWAVVPEALIDPLVMLTQNLYICPPTVAQHAGVVALRECRDEVVRRRAVYRERADLVAAAIEPLGFRVAVRPQGAFYLYADVSALTDDSFAFCTDLLERAHVAITPGADFGLNAPERHVRFSLANSANNLREGVRRIAAYLGKPTADS